LTTFDNLATSIVVTRDDGSTDVLETDPLGRWILATPDEE